MKKSLPRKPKRKPFLVSCAFFRRLPGYRRVSEGLVRPKMSPIPAVSTGRRSTLKNFMLSDVTTIFLRLGPR